jgi:hypothetical protein
MSRYRSVGQVLAELDLYDARLAAQLAEGGHVLPVRAVMVEKRGDCDLPLGAVLPFNHPAEALPDACPGLMCALRPFVIAAALGIPAVEPGGYLVSCPSKKGTVWQIQSGQ